MEIGINIPLNRTQKIIFLMLGIAVVCISIFWLLVYRPTRTKMESLKKELSFIESEIKKIEVISGGERNLDIAYKKFFKRYSELKNLIPAEEKETLNLLSTKANEMGIDVLSLKPGNAHKSNLPVEIKGKVIYQMPISMQVECDYVTLGEYLDTLRKADNTLIVVNGLDIKRPSGGDADYLNVSIKLMLYMLKET